MRGKSSYTCTAASILLRFDFVTNRQAIQGAAFNALIDVLGLIVIRQFKVRNQLAVVESRVCSDTYGQLLSIVAD